MPIDTLPPSNRIIAILIRHGRTSFNSPSRPRLRAWEDPPLSDEGRMDIQLTGNKLKFYKPKMVYSSDFRRDSESAMIIAEMLGNIPYETNFALRTANIGTLSGLLETEAQPRILRWYQNPNEPAPSGESLNQFANRYTKFLEPKMELAREVAAFRPTAFLTHGRNIAYSYAYYAGIPPEEALMPVPAGFAVIRSNQDGVDSMEIMGETEPVLSDV